MIFSCRANSTGFNTTLLDYIARRFPYHNIEDWYTRILDGRVALNDKCVNPDQLIRNGDIIKYSVPEWPEPDADLSYRIVYEDETFLAVDKPGKLMVHAAGKVVRNTLIYQLRYVNQGTRIYGERLNLCNRLDKETSGLVLIGKDRETVTGFQKAFENRGVGKTYYGIVFGKIAENKQTVRHPIGKHSDSVVRMKMGVNTETGKDAVTDIEVMERAADYTLVRIKPRTGRTNQIRVHLESIGHPLVGDKIYSGGDDAFLEFYENGWSENLAERLIMPRQALHAAELSFKHPRDEKMIRIEAPIPEDMAAFWRKIVANG